jgi:hypothetical protein
MSDRLLTDKMIEDIVNKVKSGNYIDSKGLVCPDIELAICMEQRALTLKEVGEWLESNYSITYGRAPLKLTHYGFTSVFWNKLIEALKRGKMPK